MTAFILVLPFPLSVDRLRAVPVALLIVPLRLNVPPVTPSDRNKTFVPSAMLPDKLSAPPVVRTVAPFKTIFPPIKLKLAPVLPLVSVDAFTVSVPLVCKVVG